MTLSKQKKGTIFIVLVFFPFFFSLVPKASASYTVVSGQSINIGNGHVIIMGKDITFPCDSFTYTNGLVLNTGGWINSTADITLKCWHENGWLNYTCNTASSTQQIFNGSKPDRIYLGGSQATEGGVWTYSAVTKIITVNVPLPPTLPFSIQIAWTPLPTIPPTYVPPLTAATGSGLIIRPGVVLKTSSNNAKLDFSTDTSLYKVEITSTVFWLDQQYHTKHYTRYCIWVDSPNNVNLTINTWFPTGNSSARITIGAPLATNIQIGFSSPNLKDQDQAAYARYANGQAIGQIYDRTTQTLSFVVTSSMDSTFVIYATVGETAYDRPPENVDVGITNMEGCGNWVFSQYKFYNFTAKFWDGDGYADIALAQVAFTDGIYWVNLTYNGVYQSVSSGIDVIELSQGTVTILDANEIQVMWRVYFKNTVLDVGDVDLYMKVTDGSGVVDGWELIAPNYFNIYNLGGHSTLRYYDPGVPERVGRIPGGDVFDLYAGDGDWIKATAAFRNLQHIKLLPEICFSYNPFVNLNRSKIVIGMEYCLQGSDTFVDGFKVELYTGNFYSTYWQWFAKFYEHGVLIKQDMFYVYGWKQVGLYNDTCRMFIDLWFNRINASTVWGIRINSYYYPVKDFANEWLRWFTGSNYGVDEAKRKQTECFGRVRDEEGNIISPLNIKMCRINVTIDMTQAPALGSYCFLSKFNVFDLTMCQDPFVGVQTPPWDETKIPQLQQGGFLGTLWSGIQWAVNALIQVIQFDMFVRWRGFVLIMDAIFGYFGYPNLMTVISNWLASAFQWMITSITYLLQILASIFLVLGDVMSSVIWTITTAFTIFSDMWKDLVSIFTGTVGTGQEIWFAFNMPAWITLGIVLYPVFLIYIWEEEGLKGLEAHLTFMYNMFMWLVSFLLTIVEYAWAGIARLIEAIPGVE